MGWGKKTAGAKPQPERLTFPLRELLDVETVLPEGTLPSVEEAIEDAKDRRTDAAKAQIDWHQLKSKKGWTDPTLVMLMYEFIQSKGLFGDLVKFTRRR